MSSSAPGRVLDAIDRGVELAVAAVFGVIVVIAASTKMSFKSRNRILRYQKWPMTNA